MKYLVWAAGPAAIAIAAFYYITDNEQQPSDVYSYLPEVPIDKREKVLAYGTANEEAPIPSQCYTKTEGKHNPCYTCHQSYPRLGQDAEYRINKRDDGANQGVYTFSDVGETNQWSNLFADRTHWVEQIRDEDIQNYINQENYTQLAPKLKAQNWQGFIPDLENFHLAEKAFDQKGFAKDGSGWVAFNYKPFPGTFWPTNGSTDDVVIRLPQQFRQLNGIDNEAVYMVNLSLVEMAIKNLPQVDVFTIDETQIATDIDQNQAFEREAGIVKMRANYIGDAADIKIVKQQYPQGTEIMHSVRYVGVDDVNEEIIVPPRMKELRYMTKTKVMTDADIDNTYRRERKEKLDEQLPEYTRLNQRGFNNKFGWVIQGYIEDYDGELRPQGYEEDFFCMGCHAAIGTTIDQTFAFPRKIAGKSGWGYINLKGMVDAPSLGQSEGEILQYLQLNGGGNEFRENDEMFAKWYTSNGELDVNKVQQADVYQLITPSKERALALNKAYTHIVRHQSFSKGRDANITPSVNVYQQIDESLPPLEDEHKFEQWDIRLDWQQAEQD